MLHRRAVDGQPLLHLGAGAKLSNIFLAVPKADALVGAEGLNAHVCQLHRLRERAHRHGHRAPVIQVAKVERIHLGRNAGHLFQREAGLAAQIGLGLLNSLAIYSRIRLLRLELKERSPSPYLPPEQMKRACNQR